VSDTSYKQCEAWDHMSRTGITVPHTTYEITFDHMIPCHKGLTQRALKSSVNGWMDGWLGFNGILSTQVAAIMPEKV